MELTILKKNIILLPFNILYKINKEFELKLLFKLKQHYNLNLKKPITYNEKLQWIKLYDKNPLIPKCVDKYLVRDYVKEMNCEEILNELFWEGTDPNKIPYDSLPNQFVIKITHGSTMNIVVKDKAKIDKSLITKQLDKWINVKFLPCYGEWFYGIEKPRIIIEKYLENDDKNELVDYKVFCFNGKAKLIDVHTGRFGEHKRNVYDCEWNFLDNVYFKYPHDEIIQKPQLLNELIRYAEILSSNFYHVRVDFYIVNNQIYFGELTFTNGAGFDKIEPYEFDVKMGEWLKLPLKNKTGTDL